MATSRARTASYARKTSPMPPAAMRSTTWYLPSRVVRLNASERLPGRSGTVLLDVADPPVAGCCVGGRDPIVGGGLAGMAEASSGETFQDAFARIERAVLAGDTDLSRLGFWRLVREVKADPVLSSHWADQVGRIDRAAFEARVRLRFPVALGNAALALGTLAGAGAVVLALRTASAVVAGVALVAAGAIWSVCLHDLAHWAAGRVAGIRFTHYFLGGPFPPRPGLKIDYASYLRAFPVERAWMHAAGALATKVAPFAALGFWWASDAPAWSAWVLTALGLGQIATDIRFSTKSSDWKKVRRERRVARAHRSRRI